MPTPLPPKGTVLQTAEFADSLYSPIRWSIVSHIIPYYFNSWGTGSHLYTANANTLRSVHRVKVLLALVGTHISWSPCPPLLYPYCITTWVICQGDFATFSPYCCIFFWRLRAPIRVVAWKLLPLPLTMIVYHRPHTKSTGSVAQIRDFSWRLFY